MLVAIKKLASKIFVITSSVTLTLLLLEFGLRYFYPQPLNYYNFTLIQADGATDTILSPVDLRKRNSKELPKGYGPYIPNLSMQFGGVQVNINSRGWRDHEYSLEKPEGMTRIMVVGDSIAYGYGVSLEETFAKILERELNEQGKGRYEVMSMAWAGASTYSEARMLQNNLSLYTPDLVILSFCLNDILPTRSPSHKKSKPFELRKTINDLLWSRSQLYFLLRERMKVIAQRFKMLDMVVPEVFNIESDRGMSAWRATSQVLLQIATQLQQEKIKLLLAIMPMDMQISQQIADIYRREYGFVFSDSLVNGQPQELIKDFAKQQGIAYIDLLSAFQKNPEEKKFFRIYGASIDWAHPNSLGHKIIAEELKRYLSANFSTLS